MRQKSEAQIILEQVEKLDCIIQNKLIEKGQWRDMALGITASMDGERVQSSGSQSRMADAVIKLVDMEAEIDRLVDQLIDKKKEVIGIIEQLQSPMEYKLLHMRYIQYIPLKAISDLWDMEYTNVTTMHGRALRNVQAIVERNVTSGD